MCCWGLLQSLGGKSPFAYFLSSPFVYTWGDSRRILFGDGDWD